MAVCPSATQAAGCDSGQLIKGSTPSVYYCGADGKRYVFPNLKTYNTWYSDFSAVSKISDASLATIPIGGNVTYKPGARLVKVTSDPKVYAVDAGGVLRPIASESVARQLYGTEWNKAVDDIPDAFFVNYGLGAAIADAAQFVPSAVGAAAVGINVDKGLTVAMPAANPAVLLALSPSVAELTAGQSTAVSVAVTDPAGVSSASIFLNGILLKTCGQTGSPVSATCSATLKGDDYADGTPLSLYGQEVNRKAQRIVSPARTVKIVGGAAAAAGSVSLSFSSSSTTLNAGQSTTVTVSANDPAGLSSVSVFVNGAPAQTCGQSGLNTSATCTATIYGSNYPSGSTIAVYGQEVNKKGVPTISATSSLSVAVGSSTSGTASLVFSPNATTLAIGQTMTVQVAAYDTLGVAGLSVYANGTRIQSCTASGASTHANCTATIYGANYPSGAVVPVYGQASDTDGTSFVSPTSNITITPGSSLNGIVSLSFSPYATTLASGQSTTVSVSASDPAGVSSITVYVNDALVRTCKLSGTATTGTCAYLIDGSSYPAGSTISVYGQETDRDGATNISPTSTLAVSSAAVGTGSVSLFISPSVTAISGTQTATVTVNAYDPSGLAAVNVFVKGSNVHACSQSGIWPTGASCTFVVSAANYAPGTSLSIYGQGMNTSGTTTNSATSILAIN